MISSEPVQSCLDVCESKTPEKVKPVPEGKGRGVDVGQQMTALWNISGRHSGLVSHHIQESGGSAAQDQGLVDVLPEECSLLPVHSDTAWDGKCAHPQSTLLCHPPLSLCAVLPPFLPLSSFPRPLFLSTLSPFLLLLFPLPLAPSSHPNIPPPSLPPPHLSIMADVCSGQ